MEDVFVPPDGQWQRVSPDLARLRRTTLLVALAVVLVVLLVLALLVPGPVWPWALAAALVLLASAWGWFAIVRSVARWGYLERDADLYITHGAWLRRLVVVPYGRMQYVDMEAGPLARHYGIAQVRLHTASPGTTAYLPGLPAAEATRLRNRLTSLGEAQAAGL